MEQNRVLVMLRIIRKDGKVEVKDIDIPLDITANELVIALNKAYSLGINTDDIKDCYLSAEYPTILLRGGKTLLDYGVMNGTVITYSERTR